MKNRLTGQLKGAIALGSMALLVGCASTADEQQVDTSVDDQMLEELSAQIEELRALSEETLESADRAEASAEGANRSAEQALRKSQENEEKIDRMFERSMRK